MVSFPPDQYPNRPLDRSYRLVAWLDIIVAFLVDGEGLCKAP
jgi:hypothetical protein